MSNADNDQSRGRELAEKWNIFKKQEGKQSLVAFSLGPQTLFYISTNAAWVFSLSYKSYWIKLIAGKVWEWPISSSHAGLRRVPMQDMFVTRFMDLSGCSTHVVSFWVFALIFFKVFLKRWSAENRWTSRIASVGARCVYISGHSGIINTIMAINPNPVLAVKYAFILHVIS